MNRDAWFIFVGLAAALALGVLGNRAWKQQKELHAAQARLQEMAQVAENNARHAEESAQQLAALRRDAELLAERMAGATNAQHQLETEMRAALQSRDIAISELQGRLTVNIVDRILFDSGEASLKPEGMKVLDQVAGVLAGYTNRQVQVYGHTDNVPIRFKFASNWELSTARALAAVRYLSEKAGVDPRRISAVGCGEHQPIADNATPEGRARNRRIALVVLPEQFVPTDVGSTTVPPATNAPPSPGSNPPSVGHTGDTHPPTSLPNPAESAPIPPNSPPPERAAAVEPRPTPEPKSDQP